MPGCECGSAPLPFSTTPSTTSSCSAPTVSGPIKRRFTVPVWFAGEYGVTCSRFTKYLLLLVMFRVPRSWVREIIDDARGAVGEPYGERCRRRSHLPTRIIALHQD